MKSLTLELLTAQMDDDDWSSLRGAVGCALYNVGDAPEGELDRAVLVEVIRRLPLKIWDQAFRWGFGDSVVGDNVVEFLQSRLEELGSLELVLQGPPEPV